MLTQERYQSILSMVNEKNAVTVSELAELLEISESTVRRDLTALDELGKLKKVFGGATAITKTEGVYEDNVSLREHLMSAEKTEIAKYSATLINNTDFVFIDSGTTTFFIAQALSHHENLTIITNDLYIAYQTPLHPSSTLIVTGGTRRQGRQELVGTVTENFIRDTHVDIAFIGVDGIDLTGGATNANFAEVGVKRLMLEAAARGVIVADHSKFGRIALARICDIKEASLILTDTGIDGDMLTRLKKLGVQMETV